MIFRGGGNLNRITDSPRNSKFAFKTAWIDAENRFRPPESLACLSKNCSFQDSLSDPSNLNIVCVLSLSVEKQTKSHPYPGKYSTLIFFVSLVSTNTRPTLQEALSGNTCHQGLPLKLKNLGVKGHGNGNRVGSVLPYRCAMKSYSPAFEVDRKSSTVTSCF